MGLGQVSPHRRDEARQPSRGPCGPPGGPPVSQVSLLLLGPGREKPRPPSLGQSEEKVTAGVSFSPLEKGKQRRLCSLEAEAPSTASPVFKVGTCPQLIFGWARRRLSAAEAWAGPFRDKELLRGAWGEGCLAEGGQGQPDWALLVLGRVLQRERLKQSVGCLLQRPSVSPPSTAGSFRRGQGQHWPTSLDHMELSLQRELGSKQSSLAQPRSAGSSEASPRAATRGQAVGLGRAWAPPAHRQQRV